MKKINLINNNKNNMQINTKIELNKGYIPYSDIVIKGFKYTQVSSLGLDKLDIIKEHYKSYVGVAKEKIKDTIKLVKTDLKKKYNYNNDVKIYINFNNEQIQYFLYDYYGVFNTKTK